LSLTSQREQGNSENKTANDSPRPKQNGSAEAQIPSTSFSPLPYITCHYRQTTVHSEQHPSSPDPQRNNKRVHHNNPNTTPVSDTLGVRASVLRDGSRPERESPLSLTYSSHSSAHLENSHQPQTNNSGPVDATTSSHHYRNVTTNNCGEGILFVLILFLMHINFFHFNSTKYTLIFYYYTIISCLNRSAN